MSDYQTGILGASSWMARELMEWMEKWRFPSILQCYDEPEACGKILHYQDHYLPIQRYGTALSQCQIVFDCREEENEQGEAFLSKDAYVISLKKQHHGEQMMVPYLNLTQMEPKMHRIWIPNAAFLGVMGLLSVLQTQCTLRQVVVTTMHSVAELGEVGCKDLMEQVHAYAQGKEMESNVFPLKDAYQHLPLLFQVLPQTSGLCAQGSTCEEAFLNKELKAWCSSNPQVDATCVRVAGLRGLSISLSVECEQAPQLDALIDAFASDPNIICIDDIAHNMYPICADVIHDYRIYIGRMRKLSATHFGAWAVCDDLAIRCSSALKCALYLLHHFLEVSL